MHRQDQYDTFSRINDLAGSRKTLRKHHILAPRQELARPKNDLKTHHKNPVLHSVRQLMHEKEQVVIGVQEAHRLHHHAPSVGNTVFDTAFAGSKIYKDSHPNQKRSKGVKPSNRAQAVGQHSRTNFGRVTMAGSGYQSSWKSMKLDGAPPKKHLLPL